jgi:predicted MFS family arabinose efflux permease
MVGGRAFGVVVTASLVGFLAQQVSWMAVFWLLAVFTLMPMPLVLGTHELQRPAERTFQWRAFGAFRQRSVVALSALGFLFFLIIAGANQNVNPFLQEAFGIDLRTAGFLTTVWGLGVVLGGVTGGGLIRRIGQQSAVLAALTVAFVSIGALALTRTPATAWPLVALFGLAYGTCQTVYFALAMHHTDTHIAASMFSILMAVSNVAQGAGMAIAGLLSDWVGFRWTFALLAGLNVLALPLLSTVFARPGLSRDRELSLEGTD